ncbi:hypothetical protein AKJ09_05149 [Labilithrix luteola]|uniref:Lipoprotein n=1 Tax=Labilithrix luteola TaxID=1391654 RepID=A0A0K1PY79_9BACT|nr:hypothetical protein [Labilithrix luteola]AKU98485.1 hypothetical protein AKJ09_05149 [Labilithrix luteola]
MRPLFFCLFSALATLPTVAVAVAAASLGGCSRAGAGVVAPVELAIGPVDAGAENADTGAAQKPEKKKTCTAQLMAGEIDTGPGCVLDERISHGPGKLMYPCEGDGAAQASFDDQVYDGKVVGNVLTLRLTTELDWEDGCRWQSEHMLGGRLIRGEAVEDDPVEPLQWRYEDRAISGRNCSGACLAQAEIEVVRNVGSDD